MITAEDRDFLDGFDDFLGVVIRPGFKWFIAQLTKDAEVIDMLSKAQSWDHYCELRGKYQTMKEIKEAPEKLVARGEMIRKELASQRKKS